VRTQVLDVFVAEKRKGGDGGLLGPGAGPEGFVDHYAVRDCRGDEGGTIRQLGRPIVVVHPNPRGRISQDAEDQGEVPATGQLALWNIGGCGQPPGTERRCCASRLGHWDAMQVFLPDKPGNWKGEGVSISVLSGLERGLEAEA